ncbi:PAS domain-containing protein [Streptomyces sp. RB6PN25]|uniref:PAS domain-containing protein n=1 Tax=Streptomyces humicola TaxID=2953240 RepID=A0ABT1Q3J4_9ACTN|nr:PAS domain-containing protein [Streptomyces humicola]MCQ4084496.1 PAS domain-containing protein [Streptomyces humicola]
MSSRPSRGAARLAAILDALPDALLLVNANGTVVNANAIALETFEAPGTALVGRGLLDLLPEFDSRRIPGSMRRPDPEEGRRTKPTRMVARRTDGSEFPVEVTSANLEDSRTPYADPYAPVAHYSGDELLMLVVRDLTGTLDTEAELARQQRQTEMILRAASEGVVGVDTEGKVVLVNPAAAQILGFRASDLGGQELHPLVHHTRADGSPLPFEETPLADTLRSGRKHRVRGQVLWRKDGRAVPVDLTTAPVREGDQLVGAVMTFTDRSRYDALAGRHAQLRAVLDSSLRAPLGELRGELTNLASDPAGQLWPEANQTLHHLAAGYARMTTLIDNVLSFQRLDAGKEKLERQVVALDTVVAAGVEGAIELIGPGRAQYAVHAPPINASVDPTRLAQALAHLIADVAGVDATGRTAVVAGGGDSTIVVAAAQRGDVVRIEVRGPHSGGDPVHLPITRGIVERHGGVLQTHEVPGQGGSAYVLEVPVGDADDGGPDTEALQTPKDGPTRDNETTVMPVPAQPARGTQNDVASAEGAPAERAPRPRRPVDDSNGGAGTAIALPAGPSAAVAASTGAVAADAAEAEERPTGRRRALRRAERAEAGGEPVGGGQAHAAGEARASGRRARRTLAEGQGQQEQRGQGQQGRQSRQPELPPRPAAHALPPGGQTHPVPPADGNTDGVPAVNGSHGAWPAPAPTPSPAPAAPDLPAQVAWPNPALPQPGPSTPVNGTAPAPQSGPAPLPEAVEPESAPAPRRAPKHAPPGPASQSDRSTQSEGRAISVRTLGQGVQFAQAPAPEQAPVQSSLPVPAQQRVPQQTPQQPAQGGGGSGRRRKLATPQAAQQQAAQQQVGEARELEPAARPHPSTDSGSSNPAFLASDSQGEGQAFAIGAPAEGAEGPEHLDGPGGAVEVSTAARAEPAGTSEPDADAPVVLDGPRRLLVWPEPDVSTRQALTDRGYRPVTVRSREEVDAQVAEYPAALFVDPLTGPITRTALQSLRAAAVAAEVPVLVTAGLGQATREAAYGADPAVLLKALAPRDSEQHPPRVLLVESHQDIASAFTATLERRGMQVAHAASEEDAAALAERMRPNLVVMDLMLIRRRRLGIVDWLRVNGLLNRTPLVVYTSVDIDPAELPRLGSGETVLFLAERSTSGEVQTRIVDLLSKIGTDL